MSRMVYTLVIAAVLLFGLLFLFSRLATDEPVKPMSAAVTGTPLTPATPSSAPQGK